MRPASHPGCAGGVTVALQCRSQQQRCRVRVWNHCWPAVVRVDPCFPVSQPTSLARQLARASCGVERSLGQGTGSQPTEDMRDGSVCVWEGSFRFQDLVHLRDSALEALLPDGYLILRFSDGLCVPMDGLDPKGQQELLADSLSGTAAAAATSDQFPAAIELREVEQRHG